MPQNWASNQDSHCLPLIQQYLQTSIVSGKEVGRGGGGHLFSLQTLLHVLVENQLPAF